MRHILAVAVLGMSLAFGASAAVAGVDNHEGGDKHFPAQQTGPQMQVSDEPQQTAPADPFMLPPTGHTVERER